MKKSFSFLFLILIFFSFLVSASNSQNLSMDAKQRNLKQRFVAPLNTRNPTVNSVAKPTKFANTNSRILQNAYESSAPVFLEWASIFGTDASDFLTDMCIDGIGNSYVTGFVFGGTMITIKYNSSGDSVWVSRIGFDGRSIKVDGSGNVYVAGADTGGAALFKFDPSGNLLWEKQYAGPGQFDYFTDLEIDASGNLCVTGFSLDIGFDLVAAKYDPSGNELWFYRDVLPGNFDVFAVPVLSIDPSDNIFLAYVAMINEKTFDMDYLTVKLNSAGSEQWKRTYDGGASLFDGPNAIDADNSGNVGVTGGISDTDTSFAYGTIKYNSAGDLQWSRKYDYSLSGAMDIEFDNSGNAFITGQAGEENPPWYGDYVTIKYDVNGDSLWVRKYAGIINSGDAGKSLALDAANNVYVTGISSSLNDLYWDLAIVSYTSSGTERWVTRYSRCDSCDNYLYHIAVDIPVAEGGPGKIYTAGFTFDPSAYQDITTLKFIQDDPLPVDLNSFTSAVSNNDVTLYWTTSNEINNSRFDIERKLSQTNQWSQIGFVNGTGSSSEPVDYSFTDQGLNTGKYNYRLKQIDLNGSYEYHYLSGEVSIGVPDKFSLSQNYPNPFNPATTIQYSIAESRFVTLKIYDILGNEVASLVNETIEPGNYKIKFDGSNLSSGIYLYKIIAGKFSETKRMTLIK